jgi:hypothetical protein
MIYIAFGNSVFKGFFIYLVHIIGVCGSIILPFTQPVIFEFLKIVAN